MSAAAPGEGSLVKRAMDAVRAHIHSQELKVGDTLPGEKHFATQLSVSRAVMREAFGALAALRLIDVGNGRRPKVGALDETVIAKSLDHAIVTSQVTVPEVWDVRRTIELRTASLAARSRTEAEAERILELAAALLAAGDDLEELAARDIEFHQAIARASHNALFEQIVRAFGPLMQVAIATAWRSGISKARRGLMIRRHRALANAIAARDPVAAAAAMEAHFDESVARKLARRA